MNKEDIKIESKNDTDIIIDIDSIFNDVNLGNSVPLEQIPNLDLYMDQVITLFEDNLGYTRRNENDKLLTKTMINNYTKDKLLMNALKKKYTKNHILLMILIYFLKQSMSIGDIKILLNPIVNKIEEGKEIDLEKIYSLFLKRKKYNEEKIKKDIKERISDKKLNYEEKLVSVLEIVDMANGYKRISEKIIDDYFDKK